MIRANSADLTCCACMKELDVGEEYLQCMVKTCGKLYHRLCTNRNLTMEEIDSWVCPECRSSMKKGGRNCDTPVGTPVSVKNIVSRNKSMTPVPPPQLPSDSTLIASPIPTTVKTVVTSIPPSQASSDLPALSFEMQLMRDQMTLLSEQLMDAVSTIAQYQSALTDCTTRFEAVDDRLRKLELGLACSCKVRQSATIIPDKDIKTRKQKPRRKQKPKKSVDHETNSVGPTATENVVESEAERTQTSLLTGIPAPGLTCSQSSIPESGSVDVESHDDAAEGEFKEVKKRKKLYTSVRGSAGPDATPLRAVEYRKYFHLWNMVSGADEIREYLQSLYPDSNCIVEKLKPKGEYKSYKIGVPPAVYDSCLTSALWPDNARVKPWLFRKYQGNGNHTSQRTQ
jgi:hypothetical protein